MLTALAATLIAVATAAPQPAATARPVAASPVATTTLATVLPPPGAWALMGMGCVALVRARRTKK